MTSEARPAAGEPHRPLDVKIVTGLSGSGKSTALRLLEDLDYFCVDNLPTPLAPELVRLCSDREGVAKLALGIDTREKGFLRDFEPALRALRAEGRAVEVLFLDAADDVLLRRFSETRRPHPLSPGGDVMTGIATERAAMAGVRALSDRVIDTSNLSVHDLRRRILDHLATTGGLRRRLALRLVSFGFKYGTPLDADIVLDARFLSNPYFVDVLRPLAGTDPAVMSFVTGSPDAAWFLDGIEAATERLLPLYEHEGKAYVTVAVGCTGGRHRSVALVETLGARLARLSPEIRHRDVDRGAPRETP
ncbi:MAG: RNase adapter RapZ [Myxococcota bacterium]|nr:RNase adapter RapZ [Myxococcota bacterium]